MKRLEHNAVLFSLIDKLRDKGSWCGETHLQKAVYFLQDLLKVDLGYDFIIYKHGPFSFDFRDKLTGLRADNFLELEVQTPPYGPRFNTTAFAKKTHKRFEENTAKFSDKIDFVAGLFEGKKVEELERLGTALFITLEYEEFDSTEERAKFIHEIKPHVSYEKAEEALLKIDEIRKEAKKLVSKAI